MAFVLRDKQSKEDTDTTLIIKIPSSCKWMSELKFCCFYTRGGWSLLTFTFLLADLCHPSVI